MSIVTTYNPLPISFTHGKGVWLYDADGKQYLDSFAGIAVCGLGHAHPDVTKTIQKQAARLIHTSNAFIIEPQQKLAERLIELTHMQQAFFCNSGAEANEAAIKLCRLYGHKKNILSPSIIVMENAFHGRTMATLTATGSRKVQAGFEPFVSGFVRAPFNDIEAIHTIANNRDDVVAVMLELIQGEGGITVADQAYLHQLATLCQQKSWLLIIDEIQTGMGRTGKLYGFMHTGIQPDILTTAKSLGNGVPIAACLMNTLACDLFKPGSHGSTFGGNHLACATALTVLDVIERDNLCELVTQNSIYLREKLLDALREHPHVQGIRGMGYMLGIEVDKPVNDIKAIGLKHGILLNVTAESVIRLLPALIISKEEIEMLVERLVKSINAFYEM